MMVGVVAVAFVLGVLVASVRRALYPHITVTIFNDTGALLSDVRVSFSGGERTASLLLPGGVATSDIQSYGDSGIILSYRDSTGALTSSAGLAYIESGYRGFLEIHVRY